MPSSCVSVYTPGPIPIASLENHRDEISVESLNNAKNSFLQVKKTASFNFCKEETKKQKKKRKKAGKKKDCIEMEIVAFGSSFAIAKAKINDMNGSLILTAGHICDNDQIAIPLKKYGKTPEKTTITYKFRDIKNRKYSGIVIDIDVEPDLCIMFVSDFSVAKINPIRHELNPGDRVWNIAAPTGLFGKGMVPIFSGYFAGLNDDKKATYSIPAAPGSSGSPLINSHGELVGVLVALHREMPHISYSPSTLDLYKFIIDSCDQCGLRYYIVEDNLQKLETP